MKIDTRLILVNIGITCCVILFFNLASNMMLMLIPSIKSLIGDNESKTLKKVKREDLPNYSEQRDFVKTHFRELDQSESQYEAFIGWSKQPFSGKTINIDANGDRIHQNKEDRSNINQSIHFFGGSTMWGFGVSDQDTIPALFSSISGIHTYNKSELGFNSRQSLARMINLIVSKEPMKTVVFYDGVNDVTSFCRSELKPNEHIRTHNIRDRLEIENLEVILLETLDFLFTRQIKRLITKLSSESESYDHLYNCDNNFQKARKVAETLVNNWQIGHNIATGKGINFVAILQPVSTIGTPKLDHLNFDPNLVERGEQYKAVYPLIQEIIRERQHKWILDYTDIFSRDEYIYIDFCHVSENGNKIVADQLYKDITNLSVNN